VAVDIEVGKVELFMAEHSSEHHLVPVKYYIMVFTALMVFTVLTVVVAKFDLGNKTGFAVLNAVVALTIAVIKATLVVLIFMHARWSSRLTQVIIVSGIFWLIIMLTFTLSDYLTRSNWPASPTTPPRVSSTSQH
jgi:cytochrome c oxidase subunit 4